MLGLQLDFKQVQGIGMGLGVKARARNLTMLMVKVIVRFSVVLEFGLLLCLELSN